MEQCLLHLEFLNEDRRASLKHNESHKACTKAHLKQEVQLHLFSPCDVVLTFDVAKDKNTDPRKFIPVWRGSYIVTQCLDKGAYVLSHLEGGTLDNPINRLCLNKFYP